MRHHFIIVGIALAAITSGCAGQSGQGASSGLLSQLLQPQPSIYQQRYEAMKAQEQAQREAQRQDMLQRVQSGAQTGRPVISDCRGFYGAYVHPGQTIDDVKFFKDYFGADLAALSDSDLQALIASAKQCAAYLRTFKNDPEAYKGANWLNLYATDLPYKRDRAIAAAKQQQTLRQARAHQVPQISAADAKVTFQNAHIGITEGEFRASYQGQFKLTCTPHNPEDTGSPYLDTHACFNSLAQSGRQEYMDRVAGVPAFVSYLFRNPDKALFHIEGTTTSDNYGAWRQAFIEKWGQPNKTQRIVVTNPMGAQFDNVILTWQPSANVKIVLQEYTDAFPVTGSGQGSQYDLSLSAFQIVHVPTETTLINSRPHNL